ncbi:MAG: NADH:ubiquinone oxidoreductase subunit NDUFA12 [Rhodospirillaceae bacterium]
MFKIGSLLTLFDSIQIHVFTWRRGILVGTDAAGNRYYRARKIVRGRRERRWVVYQGEFDASKVPPEWYGWLHHTTNEVIQADSAFQKPWVKPHHPNLTGTDAAYRQPGHPLRGGQRPKATGDYEPWQPA